ncbi:MAG: glycoside hydrolase family 3 C-terminal domain-containing protein [Bacteroidales bacterium]|nr:glycoside hydrolase family 3 C-terminal domain-containing protein [Bacteroidales bacterium]MCF8389928.1 glycoside hydrolase family 3 C-terminal domain-containing protein [Bacteroidales bacterium]
MVWIIISLIIVTACNKDLPVYLDQTASVDKRVNDLLSRMTLEEKLGQMNLDWTSALESQKKEIFTDGEEDPGAKNESANNYQRLLDDIRDGKVGITRNVEDWEDSNRRQETALQSRLKIPLLIAQNAVHGVGVEETSVFPVNLAMASSFDTCLTREISEMIAIEARSWGFNWSFSPTVDIARDARWGRCGETFGEDPFLCGEMGRAMVIGFQGNNFSGENRIASCLKHFVAGGRPLNGLNFAPVEYTERSLREDFFPPFKRCVEAGAWSVMPAHHDIGGIPCHANSWLLLDILKKEWGFQGAVVTDWMDMERLMTLHKLTDNLQDAFTLGINSGIDIHNNGQIFIEPVKASIESGEIEITRIDEAVKAILKVKFQLGLFENPFATGPVKGENVLSEDAQELAYEMAAKSIVLLENKNKVLPISGNKSARILITGPYAHSNAILGDWIRQSDPSPWVKYIDEGLKENAPDNIDVEYFNCGQSYQIEGKYFEKINEATNDADYVILVVGGSDYRAVGYEEYRTGGENHARQSIELAGNQIEYAKKIKAINKKLIVALINGRPLDISWFKENADAILECWNPGMEGGRAVADIIYGKLNPSGKLAISIPGSIGQLHSWYNHKPSTWFRDFQFGETGPLYEFGYGLSYSEFEYSNLIVPENLSSGMDVNISVNIKNISASEGEEIALLYINDQISTVVTPTKKLVGFHRLKLDAGETKKISFTINSSQLELWNKEMKSVIEPGLFTFICDTLTAELEIIK